MTPTCTSNKLDALFSYLDGLTERARVEDLTEHLEALTITIDDVADYVHFSPMHYLRNLIQEGPLYQALALCWSSGQRSPIHNHGHSVCGVRVLTGIATETKFELAPCGQLKPTTTRDLPANGVCVSVDTDTHQVSNLQSADKDLVTLHIYSPPLLKMETYSLTDGIVGEFRPMDYDYIHGGGI